MTILIDYRDGGRAVAIPFTSIDSATKSGSFWTVTTARGEVHNISNDRWEMALAATPITSSPALPGSYLVSLCSEDDGTTSLDKINVVAWATYGDGSVRPVSMCPGEADGTFPFSVLMPDGTVESSQSGLRWSSLDEWREARGGPTA